MKFIFGLLLVMVSVKSQASIVCSSSTSKMILTTDEGVQGNLVSIRVFVAGFKNPIVFESAKGDQLLVNRSLGTSKNETAYLASNEKSIVTLLMPKRIPEGKKAEANIFVGFGATIIKGNLLCSDDSNEGT